MNHKFLEPIKVGNVELKNRIFYLGMAKFFSTMDGQITDREVAYVESIAEGGVAMHIVGGMVIDPTWPSTLPMQPGIYDDSLIPGLSRLTEAAHKHGAKILFQPWHPGQLDYSGGNPPHHQRHDRRRDDEGTRSVCSCCRTCNEGRCRRC